MNSDQGQWLILITIPLTEWSQYPKHINSPFDKLCLSCVTIVTSYHQALVISKSGSHRSWCTKYILNQPHIQSFKPPGSFSWSPRLSLSMNKLSNYPDCHKLSHSRLSWRPWSLRTPTPAGRTTPSWPPCPPPPSPSTAWSTPPSPSAARLHPHGHPDNVHVMLREWPVTPLTRF